MRSPWTSRRRLLTALSCGVSDRVPISTYELCGYNAKAWENNHPSYRRLMDHIRAHTDCIAMWGPSSNGRAFASAYPVPIDTTCNRDGHRTRTIQVMHTPQGDLRRVLENDDRVYTTWTTEHWCKTFDDVGRALSVPYQPVSYDAADLARITDEVADHGIIMDSISDPAYMAADLMAFQDFTLWAFEHTEHFAHAVDVFAERVMTNLANQLDACVVDLYRICGPEYFTPPYLPPSVFERFVVPHVTAMTDLIHARGGKVRLHCHGKIARVLDMILDCRCDGIDPCEPPPDGDIELNHVKVRCAARPRKVSVFGNIELKLLENGSPQQVREEVIHVMNQAKRDGGFVLMPTAAPIDAILSPKTEANYIAMIDTARQFGGY